MSLIKAKQLDISTVATELTSFFTNVLNATSRNNFVNSIKDAPGFDEKVKAGPDSGDIPGYLIDKLSGDPTTPAIQIVTSYDIVNKKVKLSAIVDPDEFVPLILAELTILQLQASTTMPTLVDTDLISKNLYFVVREGFMLFEGSNEDEYTFDNSTGTITFNTPVNTPERLRIFYA